MMSCEVRRGPSEPAVSGFGQAAYHAAVEKAKRYIYNGDIMQVVPSQRMSKPFRATPLALYRAHGFVLCGPFEGYVEDPNSLFLTLDLDWRLSGPWRKPGSK